MTVCATGPSAQTPKLHPDGVLVFHIRSANNMGSNTMSAGLHHLSVEGYTKTWGQLGTSNDATLAHHIFLEIWIL